jgi:hypothetical protein
MPPRSLRRTRHAPSLRGNTSSLPATWREVLPGHRRTDVRGSTEQPLGITRVQLSGGKGGTRGTDRIFWCRPLHPAASPVGRRACLVMGGQASGRTERLAHPGTLASADNERQRGSSRRPRKLSAQIASIAPTPPCDLMSSDSHPRRRRRSRDHAVRRPTVRRSRADYLGGWPSTRIISRWLPPAAIQGAVMTLTPATR